MRPQTRPSDKIVFPSIAKLLRRQSSQPSDQSPLPNQSRLPQVSSNVPTPTIRNLQPPPEPPQNEGILLQRNTDMVTTIRNRLATGRKESFYYLTIPGILRIIEFMVAILNVGTYGFYSTFYEDVVEFVIPPFFLATTREVFFCLAVFNSFIGCFCLIIAGIFSSMSNKSIISSLYPFIFDLMQLLLVIGASISNIQFYRRNYDVLLKIAPRGLQVKTGIAYVGIVLSLLHFISGMYDVVFFMKRLEFRAEAEELEEEAVIQQ
ncbi:uncharacterized protein CDAR_260221 [Caerostris darwini]|uniref:Uncharacterized protein n=1 Tax=Caerostris darwini TaxID=1538125 RepID=A0AAV4SRF1_9ARAC|nr:uncharacterized protein CDAR_260221 [Caerostris darwini]